MSEKRFTLEQWTEESLYFSDGEFSTHMSIGYVCKKVEKKLNEQQSTIRRLQDLCGKSDGENAKLRIENKRLEKEVNLLRPTNLEQYEQIQKLQEENEKLRKQIQNYEQLISNSYVGEEETLDGFVGKYVIWENELQKYKNKNEMIDNE